MSQWRSPSASATEASRIEAARMCMVRFYGTCVELIRNREVCSSSPRPPLTGGLPRRAGTSRLPESSADDDRPAHDEERDAVRTRNPAGDPGADDGRRGDSRAVQAGRSSTGHHDHDFGYTAGALNRFWILDLDLTVIPSVARDLGGRWLEDQSSRPHSPRSLATLGMTSLVA